MLLKNLETEILDRLLVGQGVTLHTLEAQLQETTNLALKFGNFLSVMALFGSL